MRVQMTMLTSLVLVTAGFVAMGGLGDAHEDQAPPGNGNGNGQGQDVCTPNVALENENVKIWFQGLKGHIRVSHNNDTNNVSANYRYNTGAVVELDDDGDQVAEMDLGRAFPHTSDCEIVETDTHVNITLSITEDVTAGTGQSVGTATVTFDYNFNKTGNGAKFDLLVEDWPWQGDGDLAYDFTVKAAGYTIEDAENGLGFRDENGDSAGYIDWAPNATAEYEDGHNETAIVDSDVDNDGSRADVRLAFTQVNASYERLVYDPWAGMGDYIIIAGYLIGLAPVEEALPAPLRPVYEIVSDLV